MTDTPKETTYWKSLNELAQNEEYKKFAEREFPEDASELTDQVSRRSFLRVMGASIALAGFASCRKPVQKILPYTKQPEDLILGEPNFYATSMPFQDTVTGLIVQNSEGRPTKLEGNEDHPSSGGRTNIYHQAAMLGMYDPDRSRHPRMNGNRQSLSDFETAASDLFSDNNKSILFISEANSSPTYNRLKDQTLNQFPNSKWVTYEPFGEDNSLNGTNIAFGRKLRVLNHYDEANVVVSFDDDFLTPSAHKNSVENARKITSARKVTGTDDEMSRLYSLESGFSITGSYADNRLRLKSSEIEPFIYALANYLSANISGLSAFQNVTNALSAHEWVQKLGDELLANQGESIVSVGNEYSAGAHAAVAAINVALGNVGSTITYHQLPHISVHDDREAFAEAVNELRGGQYDAVIMIGTNPIFTAPADVDFAGALLNAETTIHLSDYYNETSKVCNWHINRAHFLETWSDGLSYTGHRSVIQPQILPLFDGINESELLSIILNGEKQSGYDLVRDTWRQYYQTNFTRNWEQVLHDGIDSTDGFSAENVSLSNQFSNSIQDFLNAEPISGTEIVIKPDPRVYDGRYSNIGWLQELPDPMTKITWDNVALMSPATARSIGISPERSFRHNRVPMVRIAAGDTTIEIAAWVEPGHADDNITLYAGYGRENSGRVASGVGVDVYPLRLTTAMFYQPAEITDAGKNYEIASVQDHHNLEGRDMIRTATLEEYKANPEFATFKGFHGFEVPGMKEAEARGTADQGPVSLFTEQYGPDHEPQWGMAIDLNACFGCGVCTIACQAENNIPVVGKREVGRRRAMHWIRTDRYYEGDPENPKVYHQPVPCMHCELAPCEQVCPVAATVHSDDGMNQMTYNRCIGTRYCANNCPYKVRRFNFFNYTKEFLTNGDDPEIIQMAMNPDVTIRFRGVMEKCSYCVQRVNRAKSKSRLETGSRKPADGSVQTACQQACPANAITFGDLTDRESKVSVDKQNERNYVMLEEMNVRPRTSYLAKLSNPNSELA